MSISFNEPMSAAAAKHIRKLVTGGTLPRHMPYNVDFKRRITEAGKCAALTESA